MATDRPFACGQGLCPNCDDSVPRTKMVEEGRVVDQFDCPRCGTFAYANDGPTLPIVVPAV